ncbi:hypothetical protein QVD17_04248 [Tagetes erecta]|uniref:Uncharacterized protein n=1 Tax=Tagetes erecta TaxID=13708 RepID=A0AAD8PAA7_TARER|nr:hypothetical protein QVD17_04248 [Tagetes erecta]
MYLICLGCHSIPRTISSSDFTEGCGGEQASRPRPVTGKRPKLVHGPSKKLKASKSAIVVLPTNGMVNKDRSFKRKDDGCKPRLMRSGGMRRDWSVRERPIVETKSGA